MEASREIILDLKENDKKIVLFITSAKIRAIQTAQLLSEEIKKILGKDTVKFVHHAENNLKGIEQGEFILPENYVAGDFFEGLEIGSKIFFNESLNPKINNINYRFGDPFFIENKYKYPELLNFFSEPGETYFEAITRIFTSVVQLGLKIEKLSNSNVLIVIVGHGYTYQILKNLAILACMIENRDLKIGNFDIIQKLWEIYNDNKSGIENIPFIYIDIKNLYNKSLISALNKEIYRINRT